MEQRKWDDALVMLESAHLRGCQKATIELSSLTSLLSKVLPEISCDAESMLLPLQQMGNAEAATALAGVYAMHGKFREAETSSREAISMGDRVANGILGHVLFEQGRCNEARQYLEISFMEDGANRRVDRRKRAMTISMLCSLLAPVANFNWPRSLAHNSNGEACKCHGQGDCLSQKCGQIEGKGKGERKDSGTMVQSELIRAEADRDDARAIHGGAIPGDFVEISGLQSDEGKRLNGHIGVVLGYAEKTDRQRTLVPPVGIKQIRMCNLRVYGRSLLQAAPALEKLRAPSLGAVRSEAASVEMVDLDEQVAIKASLTDVVQDSLVPDASLVNAQISYALISSTKPPHVFLLAYSRSPKCFRDALMEGPELSACRSALESKGFQPELHSGAKVLVEPGVYPAVMEAIRLGGFRLAREHVIVSPHLESTVRKLIDDLPKRAKVYQRGSQSKVPLGLAGFASQSETAVLIKRTFINLKVKHSMRSSTDEGPQTASTTDADGRKPANHRGKGGTRL